MFSPEILTLYGNYKKGETSMHPFRKNIQSDHADGKNLIRVEYVVDNMGCEACIDAVERLIQGQNGVVKTSVTSYVTGEVEIYIDEKRWYDTKDTFAEELDQMLQKNGYELHEMGWTTKKMKMENDAQSTAFPLL